MKLKNLDEIIDLKCKHDQITDQIALVRKNIAALIMVSKDSHTFRIDMIDISKQIENKNCNQHNEPPLTQQSPFGKSDFGAPIAFPINPIEMQQALLNVVSMDDFLAEKAKSLQSQTSFSTANSIRCFCDSCLINHHKVINFYDDDCKDSLSIEIFRVILKHKVKELNTVKASLRKLGVQFS